MKERRKETVWYAKVLGRQHDPSDRRSRVAYFWLVPDLFPTWSLLLLHFHLRRKPQGCVSYCAGGDEVLSYYQLVQELVDDNENYSFVRLSHIVLSKRLYEDLCYPRRTPKRIKLLATLHDICCTTRTCFYIADMHLTVSHVACEWLAVSKLVT